MRNGRRLLIGAAFLAAHATAHAQADSDALAQAITANDLAGIEAALDAGSSPNQPLAYGESPIARAVETQDRAMVALLLEKGARPNTADAEGLTPLALACERGSEAIVTLLIDARADVRRAAPDGSTPLAICARHSTAGTVVKLLAKGAKADALDMRGQTPLMWAASSGNVEAVGLLLKAGAKPNRITKEGFTPLFFAIASGSREATRALLDAGADAAHRGPENTSAVQIALYQKNWRAAQMLVERSPVDFAERDRNGEQLLHAAAAGGDEALVALLLEKGADPNGLTGPSRITWVTEANAGIPPPIIPPTPPLLIAAQHGQSAVMKRLVAGGANPAFVAENGVNVLLAAASSQSVATLEQALTIAPDANVADANGATALHIVIGGVMHPELAPMLRALAAHGARPDAADKKGITPAQIAENGLATVKAVYDQVFGRKSAPVLASAHP